MSPSDTPERWTFREKLRRYRQLGVNELAFCNLDAAPGKRLRVWDRLEGDLVERVVEDDRTPCLTLGLHLLLGRVNEFSRGLRLARNPEGHAPILSLTERLDEKERALVASDAARAASDAALASRERALAAKEKELLDATRRAASLEARLRRASRKSTTKRRPARARD